jgi:hypothetical protein
VCGLSQGVNPNPWLALTPSQDIGAVAAAEAAVPPMTDRSSKNRLARTMKVVLAARVVATTQLVAQHERVTPERPLDEVLICPSATFVTLLVATA